jgi:CIC family chloride channel protein
MKNTFLHFSNIYSRIRRVLRPHKRLFIFQSCVIGLVAGASAYFLSAGVNILGSFRLHLCTYFPEWVILPGMGLLGGVVAGFLTEHFGPETTGSGIPQIKAILGGIPIPLNLRVAVVKFFGGMVALGSGLALGREGPTVQIGAALGNELSGILPSTRAQKRQLVAAGAAAGLAAAFHAPIAGIVFVIEELLKDASGLTMSVTVLACFMASIISQVLHAHSLDLSLLQTQEIASFAVKEIPIFALLGVLAGIFGSAFNEAILGCLTIFKSMTRVPLAFRVGLAGLITGIILCLLPHEFHNYAHLRDMIVSGHTSGETAMVAFVSQFVLTIVAYGSGSPGGLFAPCLTIGSSLGYLVGHYTQLFLGFGSPTLYALAGMGAFFAGVVRVPITAMVIVFEMSSDFNLVLPLMVSCIMAYLVGERLTPGSIYDRLMIWGGINPPEAKTTSAYMEQTKAKEIMQSSVEVLEGGLTLDKVQEIFLRSKHGGFPVISQGKLVGMITLSDLAKAAEIGLSKETALTDLMTPNPVSVHEQEPLKDILYLFDEYDFARLPVVRDSRLVGIITRRDIMKALSKNIIDREDSPS